MEFSIIRSKYLLFSPILVTLLFIIPAIISYTNMNCLKSDIDEKVATTRLLLKIISYENTSIRMTLNNDSRDIRSYTESFLEEVTGIKIKNFKSFVRSEFPNKNSTLHERKEFYFSMESAPPIEVLQLERETAIKEFKQLNNGQDGFTEDYGKSDSNGSLSIVLYSWEANTPINDKLAARMNRKMVGDIFNQASEKRYKRLKLVMNK